VSAALARLELSLAAWLVRAAIGAVATWRRLAPR